MFNVVIELKAAIKVINRVNDQPPKTLTVSSQLVRTLLSSAETCGYWVHLNWFKRAWWYWYWSSARRCVIKDLALELNAFSAFRVNV